MTAGSDSAPWTTIGSAVQKNQSADNMLASVGADYDVIRLPVLAADPVTSETVPVPNRFVTGIHSDALNTFVPWGVVKGRYSIVQNRDILERALHISDNSDTDVSALGVLDGGRKFFVVLDAGSIDVEFGKSFSETIHQYMVLFTSHDGSGPIQYASTDIVVGCSTVARFLLAPQITARHTPNLTSNLDEAGDVINSISRWRVDIVRAVDTLKSISVPPDSPIITNVLENLWPKSSANTAAKAANRRIVESTVRHHMLEFSTRGRGWNGWSLLNAINSYLDHDRAVDPMRAAQDSLEISNSVYRLKLKAYLAIIKL